MARRSILSQLFRQSAGYVSYLAYIVFYVTQRRVFSVPASNYLRGIKFYENDSIEQRIGVPQRSILGPLVFSLYLNTLFEQPDNMGCWYHLYVDDSLFFFEINHGKLESN